MKDIQNCHESDLLRLEPVYTLFDSVEVLDPKVDQTADPMMADLGVITDPVMGDHGVLRVTC